MDVSVVGEAPAVFPGTVIQPRSLTRPPAHQGSCLPPGTRNALQVKTLSSARAAAALPVATAKPVSKACSALFSSAAPTFPPDARGHFGRGPHRTARGLPLLCRGAGHWIEVRAVGQVEHGPEEGAPQPRPPQRRRSPERLRPHQYAGPRRTQDGVRPQRHDHPGTEPHNDQGCVVARGAEHSERRQRQRAQQQSAAQATMVTEARRQGRADGVPGVG